VHLVRRIGGFVLGEQNQGILDYVQSGQHGLQKTESVDAVILIKCGTDEGSTPPSAGSDPCTRLKEKWGLRPC